MKRVLLALLVLNLASIVYGQLIRGVVRDEQTRKPVDFVSVFFDGTFVGTTTDEQGRFKLDVTPYKSRPLTISAIGYYTNLITDFTRGEQYQVLLAPRDNPWAEGIPASSRSSTCHAVRWTLVK